MDGWVTQAAASLITSYVVALPPADGSRLLAETGTMSPSKSTCDRVMKAVGGVWEEGREELSELVRVMEIADLPSRDEVTAIVFSLDGVMVRMKDAPNTPGAPKSDIVPNGHKEASSATACLYEGIGRSSTLRDLPAIVRHCGGPMKRITTIMRADVVRLIDGRSRSTDRGALHPAVSRATQRRAV